jgi:hypothetical protein
MARADFSSSILSQPASSTLLPASMELGAHLPQPSHAELASVAGVLPAERLQLLRPAVSPSVAPLPSSSPCVPARISHGAPSHPSVSPSPMPRCPARTAFRLLFDRALVPAELAWPSSLLTMDAQQLPLPGCRQAPALTMAIPPAVASSAFIPCAAPCFRRRCALASARHRACLPRTRVGALRGCSLSLLNLDLSREAPYSSSSLGRATS